jgi:riboflavin kinase/FMN adenylyltransferase
VSAGDTQAAAHLLGRPFELEGLVVRGAGRGRGLGFPTANVAVEGELRPKLGIYAARARVLDGPLAGTARAAALSVGTNPQFTSEPSKGSEPPPAAAVTVEAYLLDFDGDLYERRVRLEVGQHLRDERRFASVDALVVQIREDVAQVKRLSS